MKGSQICLLIFFAFFNISMKGEKSLNYTRRNIHISKEKNLKLKGEEVSRSNETSSLHEI